MANSCTEFEESLLDDPPSEELRCHLAVCQQCAQARESIKAIDILMAVMFDAQREENVNGNIHTSL